MSQKEDALSQAKAELKKKRKEIRENGADKSVVMDNLTSSPEESSEPMKQIKVSQTSLASVPRAPSSVSKTSSKKKPEKIKKPPTPKAEKTKKPLVLKKEKNAKPPTPKKEKTEKPPTPKAEITEPSKLQTETTEPPPTPMTEMAKPTTPVKEQDLASSPENKPKTPTLTPAKSENTEKAPSRVNEEINIPQKSEEGEKPQEAEEVKISPKAEEGKTPKKAKVVRRVKKQPPEKTPSSTSKTKTNVTPKASKENLDKSRSSRSSIKVTKSNEKKPASQKKPKETKPVQKRIKETQRKKSSLKIDEKSSEQKAESEKPVPSAAPSSSSVVSEKKDVKTDEKVEASKEVKDKEVPEEKPKSQKTKKSSKDLPNSLDRQIYVTKCDEYSPRVYSFNSKISNSGVKLAQSPSFYLLVDHLIAVTWKLYSKDESERKGLGIAQLQWAYEFLVLMKDKNGVLNEPMNSLSSVIEDALIMRYSKLSQKQNENRGNAEQTDELKKGPSTPDATQETNEKQKEKNKTISYTLDEILLRAPTPQDHKTDQEKEIKEEKRETNKGTVEKEEVLKYLEHIKKEQKDRALREKQHLHEIEEVIRLVQNDNFESETWRKSSLKKEDRKKREDRKKKEDKPEEMTTEKSEVRFSYIKN